MINQSSLKTFISLFLVLTFMSFLKPVIAETSADTIRFGILSIAPPARIYAKWQEFTDYISKEMGQPVAIVIPRGFKKMRKLAEKGSVDFFYINSRVFYRLKSNKQAKGVLQMFNIDGKITSKSEIYVHRDSGITNVSQLRGKNIAYVSPMGAGGYLAPRAKLMSLGVISGGEVKEVFTKNLSNSIHRVLLKDLSSGTMCGVNFALMSKKMDTGELRIIEVSDEYPENVIAARSSLPNKIVMKFQRIVANMPNSKEGKKVLKNMHSMKITKFIPYDPKIESLTTDLLKQAKLAP